MPLLTSLAHTVPLISVPKVRAETQVDLTCMLLAVLAPHRVGVGVSAKTLRPIAPDVSTESRSLMPPCALSGALCRAKTRLLSLNWCFALARLLSGTR
jgi:hypothetical protein